MTEITMTTELIVSCAVFLTLVPVYVLRNFLTSGGCFVFHEWTRWVTVGVIETRGKGPDMRVKSRACSVCHKMVSKTEKTCVN